MGLVQDRLLLVLNDLEGLVQVDHRLAKAKILSSWWKAVVKSKVWKKCWCALFFDRLLTELSWHSQLLRWFICCVSQLDRLVMSEPLLDLLDSVRLTFAPTPH